MSRELRLVAQVMLVTSVRLIDKNACRSISMPGLSLLLEDRHRRAQNLAVDRLDQGNIEPHVNSCLEMKVSDDSAKHYYPPIYGYVLQ